MKKGFQNFCLLIIAFSIFYIPIEIIWRNFITNMPLKLHPQLGRLAPLAQTSKMSLIPKDYTLLIGDSYVEGLGDWLMQRVNDVKPIYHTSHVLHLISGEDIMAFGQRGLSPTYAIASYTTQTYSGINNYAGINLKSPSRILVFFYEGNDFADELKVLTQNNILFEKVNNPEFLKNYIDKVGKGARQRADKRWHFFRNAHFIDTGTKLAKLVL